MRRTWLLALVAVARFCCSGALLQKAAPEARSIGEPVKAVSDAEERP